MCLNDDMFDHSSCQRALLRHDRSQSSSFVLQREAIQLHWIKYYLVVCPLDLEIEGTWKQLMCNINAGVYCVCILSVLLVACM